MPPTILVVNDHPALCTLLVKVMTDLGYQVQLAPDGQAALDRIAERVPDLVLTDAVLPRLDGLGLIRALWARYRGLPVVLMSSDDTARWALPEVPFVAKPFELPQLQATVARLIGGGGWWAAAGRCRR